MSYFQLPNLAFMNLGPWEIALILFLALLLFGGKKLPGLAKDLGQGIREFRKSLFGTSEENSTQNIDQVQDNNFETLHNNSGYEERKVVASNKKPSAKGKTSARVKKKT